MSSPVSCVRCSRPAPAVTPNGLCPVCAPTADTAPTDRSSADPSRAPAEAPTASFVVPPEPSTAPAPADDPRPLPASPPGHELVRRLGGGGMGEVYLAREVASERLVALKFLKHPGDPSQFERFVVELRALAGLKHPDIVGVYAHDFLRADPYFTMEYLPGGSLARATGPLPVAAAVELVRAAAAAIGAAHAAGIVHRDLKPSNILLGPDGRPKVVDFGLAKRLDAADPVTAASAALGTPGYMPPEQVSRKNGEIGPWSDVYGLGGTLYHLLTGRAPFVGDSVADTIARVLADPPPRVRALRPEVPAGLEGIVLKCLEKDPKDRYPTAAALIADLDRYAAGEDPEAPKLTRRRRLVRWARRHRGRLAAAAAAGLVLAAAFALGKPARREPDGPNPLAELEAELKAGRPLAAVGPAVPPRPPRWSEWVTGGAELTPSECWRDAIGFDTTRVSLLALARDPIAPRYRAEAELCHERRGRDYSVVGLFVGYERHVGRGGEVVERFLAVQYSDFWSNVEEDLPETRADHAVTVRHTLIIRHGTGTPPTTSTVADAALAFAPSNRPGTARRVDATVTPEAVTFRWHDGRAWAEVGALSAGHLNARTRELQAKVDKRLPQAGVRLADWNPRRPVGVCAITAAVAVRVFTLTPEGP